MGSPPLILSLKLVYNQTMICYMASESLKNISWLDEMGLTGIKLKELDLIDVTDAIDQFYTDQQYNYGTFPIYEIRRKIHDSYEIFCRFNSNLNYISLLQEYTIIVIKIMFSLKRVKCSTFIFFTSIPHNLNSRLFEIACELMNIRQISLYNIGYSNRLLPLVKTLELTERSVPDTSLSNFIFREKDIHELLSRSQTRKSWYIGFLNKSILFAMLALTYNYFTRFIISLFTTSSEKFTKLNFSLLNDLYLLLVQKRGIRFFDRNIVKERTFVSLLKSEIGNYPPVIFFAHYQPEATTYIEGGLYKNHVELVLELRKNGFKGNIFYKEHPGNRQYLTSGQGSRVALYRDEEYYKNLLDLGCTFITPNQFKQLILTLTNYTTMTITGTIALEQALKGSKVVVAGNAWFNFLPNIVSMSKFVQNFSVNSSIIDFDLRLKCEQDLLLHLNHRTIGNVFGIGTNLVEKSKDSIIEFRKLFEYLKKN